MLTRSKDLTTSDLTARGWEISISQEPSVSGGIRHTVLWEYTIKIPLRQSVRFSSRVLAKSVEELFEQCKEITGKHLEWYI